MPPERTNFFDRTDLTEPAVGYASRDLFEDYQIALLGQDRSVAGQLLPRLELVQQRLTQPELRELEQLRRDLPLAAASDRHKLNAEQVRQLMTEFERRCRPDGNPGAPSERQILQTYRNLKEILDGAATDRRALQRDRGKVFLSALYNIAHPGHIAQGRQTLDCGAAMEEVYSRVRFPDEYTDLLRQVSCNWLYQRRGVAVELPPGARRVTLQEYNWNPIRDAGSDVRNLASVIFQRVSIGIVRPGYDGRTYLGPNGMQTQFRGLTEPDLSQMSQTITGTNMTIWKLGQGTLPPAQEMLARAQRGEWPIGIIVPPTHHNPTPHANIISDMRVVNGQLEVYWKDFYGLQRDRGWIPYEELRRTDLALRPQYNSMLVHQRYRQPQQQLHDQAYRHQYAFPQTYRDGYPQTTTIPLQVLNMLQQRGFPHSYDSNQQRSQMFRQFALSMLQQQLQRQLQQRGLLSPYSQYMPSYYNQPYQYPQHQYYRPQTQQYYPQYQYRPSYPQQYFRVPQQTWYRQQHC